MSFDTLELAISEGVATVTLNRPDAANSLNPQMAKELAELAIQLDCDSSVRAILITGQGQMFCAGGDLSSFADSGDQIRALLMQMTGDLHIALSRLARTRAPVIGAVNGTAAGAGFSLAMACDLVYAVESAVFTMAYTNAGLSPDGSSTFYMPRKIGDRRTRELMLTNRVLKAPEALDWGIVNKVVADDALMEEAGALARKIAKGPTQAFGAVKTLLNGTFEQTLESQMELEARAIADLSISRDGQEGISAFLAKRKPEFSGR